MFFLCFFKFAMFLTSMGEAFPPYSSYLMAKIFDPGVRDRDLEVQGFGLDLAESGVASALALTLVTLLT